MSAALSAVIDDLVAEQDGLDALVARLDSDAWDLATPAEGWRVRDQIHHLTFFDDAARLAATDEAAYGALATRLLERGAGWELDDGGATAATELLRCWRGARAGLADALRSVDGPRRLPWFGREMSAASFTSARLMECWCHGQDIRDAVGAPPSATARLRHVVDIGVRSLPFAFAIRGLRPPENPLRLEVVAPDGSSWTWGPEAAQDAVRGTALDLALVVTQRRHPGDTGLVATRAGASTWLRIAQAFAGPPGTGRAPGMFPRRDHRGALLEAS